MNFPFFNTEQSKSEVKEESILDLLSSEQPKEIKEGMTPAQMAEIISDRLIEVVKESFESSSTKGASENKTVSKKRDRRQSHPNFDTLLKATISVPSPKKDK